MDRLYRNLPILIVIVAFHQTALAERNLIANGFITAAFSQVDSEVPFAGVKDEMNFSQSSLIGVQTIFIPTDPSMQFIVQILAEGIDGWEASAEWAFFKYTPWDNLELQMGKVRVPLTLLSESIHVGLTYPWARPPSEVFFIPFTSADGLRIKYRTQLLGGELEPQLLLAEGSGLSLQLFGQSIDIEDIKLYSLILGWRSDHLTIRGAIHRGEDLALADSTGLRDTLSNATALTTLTQLGIDLLNAPPSEKIEVENLSLSYSNGPIRLLAELSYFEIVDSVFLSKAESAFINIGYQLGQFLPHFTYSYSDADEIAAVDRSQKSIILGVRYDLNPSSAFKIEVVQSELDDGPLTTGSYDTFHPSLGNTVVLDDEVIGVNAAINVVF